VRFVAARAWMINVGTRIAGRDVSDVDQAVHAQEVLCVAGLALICMNVVHQPATVGCLPGSGRT